jgi:hypothetical protein
MTVIKGWGLTATAVSQRATPLNGLLDVQTVISEIARLNVGTLSAIYPMERPSLAATSL